MVGHRQEILEGCRPDPEIPFSPEEYRQRLVNVRKAMAAARIDALFLSSPESLCYLTGFRAEWYQAQGPKAWLPASGVAVHVDADDFIHFEVENEQVLVRFTSVSRDVRILGANAQPGSSLMDFIVRNMRDEGWLKGTIGLEMWSYRPRRGYSELFQAALESAGARVVDGSDVVNHVRLIKSPAEIECSRTAARIADVGMAAAVGAVRAGVTELDVYAEIVHAMAKAGGENPGITMPVSSGPKSACMHALASRRRIKAGEVVNIDLCGVFNRYHANLARTIAVGRPHKEVADQIARITGARAVVAGLLRPGLPVGELQRTVEAYYRDCGLWDDQCWIGGYDLGIAFPPDWVGPWFWEAHADPGDDMFRTGMVVNYEANFYLPRLAGMSMFIDTYAFGDKTVELLTAGTPAQLFVVE